MHEDGGSSVVCNMLAREKKSTNLVVVGSGGGNVEATPVSGAGNGKWGEEMRRVEKSTLLVCVMGWMTSSSLQVNSLG